MVQPELGEVSNRAPDAHSSKNWPSPDARRISRRSVIALAVVLSFSALLNGMSHSEPPTQRMNHIICCTEGRLLHLEADRRIPYYCDSQMPISVLNAAPQVIGDYLESHHLLLTSPRYSADIKLPGLPRFSRLWASLAGLLLGAGLYGEGPALAACLLCTLSPNLIAHGTLATTDMYFAVGVVGSLFFFRRYLLQPTLHHAVIAGLALALAQITKSFAIVLYGVAFLAIAVTMFRQKPPRSLTPKRVLLFAAIAVAWFIAIINLSFVFDRTFMPLGAYHFETASFQRLQQTPLLRHLAVPLPYPFLQGLDMMKQDEETGGTFGYVYLLSELRDPSSPSFHSFKSYYTVAWFYKEPIALQILFLWGLIWIVRNRRPGDFFAGEGMLLTAAAILFVGLSFFSKAQIGIRHILPVLAIETIIAGAAFSNFPAKSWPKKAILCILVLWLAGSVASYYPQMIPYMNEWVHDRRFAYRILADSNLDWGQEDAIVDQYLRQNPGVILDPPRHVSGRILVRVNRLTGVDRWTPSAAYLEKQYRPVAMVGYAHLLFEVPAKDVPPIPAKPN